MRSRISSRAIKRAKRIKRAAPTAEVFRECPIFRGDSLWCYPEPFGFAQDKLREGIQQMKAAVFYNCGDASQIQIAEVPEPEISPGQVLLRVHASAFNHLELWSLHGPADESYRFPMWTGSDIAGVIERLGSDVSGWSAGEAVVVNPSLSCGKCLRCLEGEVSQCDDYDILGSS